MVNYKCNEECTDDFDGFLTSDDVRTGFISGTTFRNKSVRYSAVNGLAVFEGCIVLGTVEEMKNADAAIAKSEVVEGIVVSDLSKRWPDGIVPYQIDPNLPDKERTAGAIEHWQERTGIRFVERTNNNANYINFKPAEGCWSRVGMHNGGQDIGLAGGCGLGATIHEIGHALGLWHEQSREDRDRHIRIHWDNIQGGKEHNFDQQINDGDDVGFYDYGSIMHYSKFAFAKDRNKPTIEPLTGEEIGNRNELSLRDISTIATIYHSKITAKHSGKVLDVTDSLTEDGVDIIQWSKFKTDNQSWRLEFAGDGYYYTPDVN